jgi:hypothetical protein
MSKLVKYRIFSTKRAKERAHQLAKQHIPLHGECEHCHHADAEVRHHPDYAYPLQVQLLCTVCHSAIHKQGRTHRLKTQGHPFYRKKEVV